MWLPVCRKPHWGKMTIQAKLKSFASGKYIYVTIFIIGMVAFLYPLITNAINSQTQSGLINNYEAEIASYDEQELKEMAYMAQRYNDFIAELEGNVTDEMTDTERDASEVTYVGALATGESIGYLKIPKIEVELPIFKGSSDEILNAGVGHLERSSLPIGGSGAHAVLTGHRGLPTSVLFRDLGLLEIGDVFLVDTLGSTLAYEVESKRVVLPTEVETLRVQEGRDLCTLVTCEPYMINSHRLLVTGHRIDYVEPLAEKPENGITFVQRYWEYFVIVGFFALIMLMIMFIRRHLRKKAREQAALQSRTTEVLYYSGNNDER